MNLNTSVAQIKGVGKTMQSRLDRLGIQKVKDVLTFFPFRYEDYSKIVKIGEVLPNQQLTIKGTIELIANKRGRSRRLMITEAVISDESGSIRVVWFSQPYIAKILSVGDEVQLSGKIISGKFGLQLTSPIYKKIINDSKPINPIILPVYHLTQGMTQTALRKVVKEVLPLVENFEDWVPNEILKKGNLIDLKKAIKQMHNPINIQSVDKALKRLKFDELFILQVRAQLIRQSISQEISPKIFFNQEKTKQFVKSLPFTLTNDQKKSAWIILQEMEKEIPMNRLLEGDVGSGKTVVAAIASINVITNNFQVVILAPTEILAKQHYNSFINLLGKEANIALLTGSSREINGEDISKLSKKKQREEIVKKIKTGDVKIIIGTHALLTTDVEFKNLGLVVVDEQHRFGVEQRKTMRQKSGDEKTVPHFLSMTATPIPRSYALMLYGDLDVSIIKEKPAGRKEVDTKIIAPHDRKFAYEAIRKEVSEGRQAFVICPLIDIDEDVLEEKKTVMQEYEKLSKEIFPELTVDFLHGKLSSKEKESRMQKFAEGKTNILVSTSVVEVGVNIPNASIMIIEGAERFGLAQLHQFRGRVGRSDYQSYCYLFSESNSEKSSERLSFFASTTDGFAVAEYDLEVRGPGEVYGTTQSGMGELQLATLQDSKLISMAQNFAKEIDILKYPKILKKVKDWEKNVHLE